MRNFSFVLVLLLLSPCAAQAPISYAGRPPVYKHYPGRCWCKYHGPRGGCIHWVCRPKVKSNG